MKKLIYTIIALILVHFSYALDFNQDARLIDHMIEVNASWKLIDVEPMEQQIHFQNEESRIQMHFLLVIKHLEAKDISHLNKAQALKRNEALQGLKAYANNLRFPINNGHNFRIPYFIDHNNTACAVGFMLRESGNEQIGQWVKSNMNNAYVAEIPTGALDEWAVEYGFSRDELAWIQPGYPPSLQGWSSMAQGLNGPASALVEFNGALIIAGEFSDASGINVNNVVAWDGVDFADVGGGVNGRVNCAIIYQGKLTLGGFFNNGQADIAIWDGNSWEYQAAFASTAGETFAFGIYLDKLYASGSALGIAGEDFLLSIWENPNWNWVAEFEGGPVYSIQQFGNEMLVGGDFLSVEYDNQTVDAANIAKFNNQGNWEEFNGGLDGFVRDIYINDNDIVVAGKIVEEMEYSFGLSKANGNSWENLIVESTFTPNYIVNSNIGYFNKLLIEEGDTLLAGLFGTSSFTTIGSGLADLTTYADWPGGNPFFVANGAVMDVAKFQNKTIVAGDFTSLTGAEFNHVAQFESPNAIEKPGIEYSFFPNPADEELLLRLSSNVEVLQIDLVDASGRRLQPLFNSDNAQIRVELSEIPSGAYTISINTSQGNISELIIVNH